MFRAFSTAGKRNFSIRTAVSATRSSLVVGSVLYVIGSAAVCIGILFLLHAMRAISSKARVVGKMVRKQIRMTSGTSSADIRTSPVGRTINLRLDVLLFIFFVDS